MKTALLFAGQGSQTSEWAAISMNASAFVANFSIKQ